MNGLPELRSELEAAGWCIERNHMASEGNACNWYAWSRDRAGIAPDCECNDKPPSLIVWPHQFHIHDRTHSGVEIEICGERNGTWWKLRAYSIRPEELMQRLPQVRAGLAAAWAACAAEG